MSEGVYNREETLYWMWCG